MPELYEVLYSNPNKLPINSININRGGKDNTLSITLSGRASIEYNIELQESILHILENFANDAPPLRLTEGQTWYDSSTGLLNLSIVDVPYNAATSPPTLEELQFIVTDFLTLSATQPIEATKMWFDTTNDQLMVFNGNAYESVMLNFVKLTGDTITGSVQIGTYVGDVDVYINGASIIPTVEVQYTQFNVDAHIQRIVDTNQNQNFLDFSTSSFVINHNESISFCSDSAGTNPTNNSTTINSVLEVTTKVRTFTDLTLGLNATTVGVANGSTLGDAINTSQFSTLDDLTSDDLLLRLDGTNTIGNFFTKSITINTGKLRLIADSTFKYDFTFHNNTFKIDQSSTTSSRTLLQYDANSNEWEHPISTKVYDLRWPYDNYDAATLRYTTELKNSLGNNNQDGMHRPAWAWCTAKMHNNVPIIQSSYNISTVSRPWTGSYRFYFDNPPGGFYSAFVTAVVDPATVEYGWIDQTGAIPAMWTTYLNKYSTRVDIITKRTTYSAKEGNPPSGYNDGGRLSEFARGAANPPNGTMIYFVVYKG